MRLAVLFSGGKDSTYAAYLMGQQGHELTHLITIVPDDPHSWMFHTLSLEHLPVMAEALGIPLIRISSTGEEKSDLDALKAALSDLDIDGIITGAIASDYQWDRINGVAESMALKVFSPLWRKDQAMLLEDMLKAGMEIMIVGVFSEGLGKEWLGRVLAQGDLPELGRISERYGMNISGEGGEFETLVMDSPLHLRPLKAEDVRTVFHRDSGKVLIGKMSLN